MKSELEMQLADANEKLVTLQRKYDKLKNGYRTQVLAELVAECKLIPLKSAKSGLYEEDLRRILGED